MSLYKPDLNETDQMKDWIKNVILSSVVLGFKAEAEKAYENNLSVLNLFILNKWEIQGTLKELHFLVDLEILSGLTNIKVHLRTRSMNK